MTTYQIIEIALEAAFFATVASISVIFCIARERYIKRRYEERSAIDDLSFDRVLERAGISTERLAADASPRKPGQFESSTQAVDSPKAISDSRRQLSGSELELLNSSI
jgi:hypothetical protein